MKVIVHLYTQSQPIEHNNVLNTYTKGDLYCVNTGAVVCKYPLQHIFRIKEITNEVL